MTRREKIILSLTATAAMAAGIYYVFGLSSPTGGSSRLVITDFSALTAKIQVSLEQSELTNREECVLAAATTQWLRNPLRERPILAQNTESQPLPQYIGFINTGSEPIAIIDGMDYRAGELIQGGEFQLSQVHPDHIKLLRRGANTPVDVPLEKEQIIGESQ